jgi:ATP dependent DNA ligase domain
MRAALRRNPLEVRKATLASIVAKARPGIRFNEHIEGDGPTVFAHACKMGLEGTVSKRKDSPYRSGCSPDWLKMKNPSARLGQTEIAMTGKNRIMIYGPESDGTYVVEFRTSAGKSLAISIPRTEAAVIRPGANALWVVRAGRERRRHLIAKATRQRARLRWRHSRRAGGGNNVKASED